MALTVHFPDLYPVPYRGSLGYAFKKAVKVSGILKTKLVGYLLNRKLGVQQPALCFHNKALVNVCNGCFTALLLNHVGKVTRGNI